MRTNRNCVGQTRTHAHRRPLALVAFATGLALAISGLSGEAAPPRATATGPAAPAVRIPAGPYRSFFAAPGEAALRIAAFRLDIYPVSNGDFARFVAIAPEWGPGRPRAIQADRGYLQHWRGAQAPAGQERMPVTNVSWFAARAYCRAQGKRLPTIAEWERAAAAPDAARPGEGQAALVERILAWYGEPNRLRPVGSVYRNTLGLYDMHGSVWEWNSDFTAATVVQDSRGENEGDEFCGAASANARSREDYAAFMRFAFRSSLRAASTAQNLGFRCASNL